MLRPIPRDLFERREPADDDQAVGNVRPDLTAHNSGAT